MSSSRRGGNGSVGGSRHLQSSMGWWRHVAVVDAACGPPPGCSTSCPPFSAPRPASRLITSRRRPWGGAAPTCPPASSLPRRQPHPPSPPQQSSPPHSSYYNSSVYDYNCNYKYRKQHQEQALAPSRPKVTAAMPQSHHARSSAANSKPQQPGSKKTKQYEKPGEENDDDVGVTVEKDSYDPRANFRESMLQMVVEMGLCGWDDLRCMLCRLLALNHPRHHADILTAFAEVCTRSPPPVYQYHAYNDPA